MKTLTPVILKDPSISNEEALKIYNEISSRMGPGVVLFLDGFPSPTQKDENSLPARWQASERRAARKSR